MLKHNTLQEALFAAAEKLGWACTPEHFANGDMIMFSQHSPAGEDFFIEVSPDNIVEEVRQAAYDFDTEEHIEMWVEAKRHGMSGVPSIRDLVDDADEIQDMLDKLADALTEAEYEFEFAPEEPSFDEKLADAQTRATEQNTSSDAPSKEQNR